MNQLPPPISSDSHIYQYIDNYTNGYWKLHDMQRNDESWSDRYYKELIESIFANTLLSPIIMSVRDDINEPHLADCIDGGHRTKAMMKFMDDKIAINCPDGQKRTWNDLPETTRIIFSQKTVNIKTFKGLTHDQEETLFFNTNNSLPLDPGEVINGYQTIPICAIASRMADKYSSDLKDKFKRAIEHDDKRAHSANLMFMTLVNFHERNLVNGQKTSNKETQKKTCEKYRNVKVDDAVLTYMCDCLFKIISKCDSKYNLCVFPTIQEIMLRHEIGFVNPCPKIAKFRVSIRDFLHHAHSSNSTYAERWGELIHHANNVTNPSYPKYCRYRANIFDEWLNDNEQKKISHVSI